MIFFIFPEQQFFIFSQLIEIQSSKGIDPIPDSCLNWLHTYFHSPDELSRTPELCPDLISRCNSFQAKVWFKLINHVPFGQTITYGQLAILAGSKNAARAVGSAMRRNPFQLIVPCHRVIRSNGVMGNYAGGERNNVKLWLLKHEKN
jgi:methylated-DNA-[protein]-cysteine S-methyltransferase